MALINKQKIDLDFDVLASDWYTALPPTANTPFSYEDVKHSLAALARDATRMLFEDSYQSVNAERIGVELAELQYVQGDAIGISIQVLSNAWLSRLTAMKSNEIHRRMAKILGDMANGYYRTATKTILDHQETIRKAQLTALQDLHADLENQRDLLRITTERLQALHEVESGILAAQSAEAIAEVAITHIMRIIPCQSASILTIDYSRDAFVFLASKNTPQKPGNLFPLSLTTKERVQILADSKSIIIDDIGALENRPPGLEDIYARGVRSVLNVPLLAMGQLIGHLSLKSTEVGAFSEQHDLIARQIADSVAVALHNRSLLETEKRARQESETLREVAATLSSSLEREELLDYILLQLEQVVPFDAGAILLQAGGRLQVTAQRGFSQITIDSLNNLEELPPNIRRLVAKRSPLIVPDTGLDPDWIVLPGSQISFCWLGAPLIYQGELIGTLSVEKYEPDFYKQSDAELVLTFANHAAVAIENAHLFNEVQQSRDALRDHIAARTRDLESLYEIAAITSQPLELQDTLRAGLLRILDDLECQSGAIHVLDKDAGSFNLVQHANLDPLHVDQTQRINAKNLFVGKLITNQKPTIITDSTSKPRFSDGLLSTTNTCYVGTPMRARGEVHGILSLYCEQEHDFTPDDIKLAASIADLMGVAIDNANLQMQSKRAAVTEERERLARDLHDSATQSLFSLTLFAAAAREKVRTGQLDVALQHLADIGYTANQTHREMRLLLYQLGSSPLLEEGLVKALERRLHAVEGRSGIKATFHPQHAVNLNDEVEQALYQIANEALNNALKHAGGTRVTVELIGEDAGVTLTVKDNGNGFDLVEANKGAGMGLRNMRLRASSMGGELSIFSSIGEGTEIVARIPRGDINQQSN